MFHHPIKLTTVKILESQYKDFKVDSLNKGDKGITLQALVNRAVYLYLTDSTFRDVIDNTQNLKVSGSFL